MLSELGIKAELDLRNPESENDYPVTSPLEDRIHYEIITGSSYAAFWENSDRVRNQFAFLLNEENYPCFFHCLAGADRTGGLAFLLEALLGMDENEIIADYEITPHRFRNGSKEEGTDTFYDEIAFVNIFKSFPGESFAEKARYYLKERCGFSDRELDWFIGFMTEEVSK